MAGGITRAVSIVAIDYEIAVVVNIVGAHQRFGGRRCATVKTAIAAVLTAIAQAITAERRGAAVCFTNGAVFHTAADAVAATGLARREIGALEPVGSTAPVAARRIESATEAVSRIAILFAPAVGTAVLTVFTFSRFANTVAATGRTAQDTIAGTVGAGFQYIANAVVIAVIGDTLIHHFIATHARAGI